VEKRRKKKTKKEEKNKEEKKGPKLTTSLDSHRPSFHSSVEKGDYM